MLCQLLSISVFEIALAGSSNDTRAVVHVPCLEALKVGTDRPLSNQVNGAPDHGRSLELFDYHRVIES